MSKRNRNRQPNSNVPARSGNNHPAVRVERRQSVTVSKSYSGPTPPPEVLAAYDQIVPGSAEKLINQFVAQGTHRMAMEEVVIRGDVRRANWGLAAGFTIAVAAIAVSFYMVYLGREIAGLGGLIMSLGSLVGAFVYGTVSRRRERIEKEKLRADE